MPLQGSHSEDESDIIVIISLSEKADLLRLQATYVDERVDHCCRLFGVASAEINDVAVRRVIAQDWTARVCGEKQRLLIVGQRNGDVCCWGAGIANDGDNLILFNQPPHVGRCAGWFVPIIECDEPQLAAVHPSVTVCAFQAGEDTPLHVFSEVSSVAGQGCRHPENNLSWRIGFGGG